MERVMTPEMIRQYQVYLTEQEKSRATVEKYMRDVRKLYDFLKEDKRIDKEKVCSFKAFLIDNYRPASVNSMLAALNSFFAFMEWELFKVKRIRMQRQMFRAEELELGINDYKKLLQAAGTKKDKRLYYILLTICSTGIRVSELPFITRESLFCGKAQVICKNKTRTVLIPTALKKTLIAYANQKKIKKGSIFITRGHQPVDRRNIWNQMKRLAKDAGVASEKVYPHNLRHLFARTYYARERDIIKLADILGHSSVETTRIYTCTTLREHRLGIERLGLMPGIRIFG